MTLREWLDKGEAQLRAGPHPDRARRDAETLLLHLIGKNRAWLLAHLEEDFGGCTAISYAGLIERRLTGEPIQYITGESEFYGLPFRVTPDGPDSPPRNGAPGRARVLPIPALDKRPKKFFSFSATRNSFGKARASPDKVIRTRRVFRPAFSTSAPALDASPSHRARLGNAEVTAIDLSASALEVARSNARETPLADCIRFLQGDLLAPVAGEKFDIIVSNPPYVPAADRDTLSVEVRDSRTVCRPFRRRRRPRNLPPPHPASLRCSCPRRLHRARNRLRSAARDPRSPRHRRIYRHSIHPRPARHSPCRRCAHLKRRFHDERDRSPRTP